MSDSATFADFFRRIRAGDDEAATELVRLYEPVIRREVRLRLCNPALSRISDSMDFCQSVLASFFARAGMGQYDLDRPEQLAALLVGMARKKVAFAARKQRAQRRDVRRVDATRVEVLDPLGREPNPSRVVAGRELLHQVRTRLSEEERRLADRRGQGQGWAAIAAELGGTPAGRRMQLARALDRVTQELGLEEGGDA